MKENVKNVDASVVITENILLLSCCKTKMHYKVLFGWVCWTYHISIYISSVHFVITPSEYAWMEFSSGFWFWHKHFPVSETCFFILVYCALLHTKHVVSKQNCSNLIIWSGDIFVRLERVVSFSSLHLITLMPVSPQHSINMTFASWKIPVHVVNCLWEKYNIKNIISKTDIGKW
jgi:hypothetical protein